MRAPNDRLSTTGCDRPPGLLLGILALLFAGLFVSLFSTGCKTRDHADLVSVVDVVPRDIEVGDTVEILGTNLPSGHSEAVTVTFAGSLHRPGQDPIDIDLEVPQAKPSPDKISFIFSKRLQDALCGQGDEASHTTFRGDVIVSFPPTAKGAEAVRGRVRQVVLDFRPPSARRLVLEARAVEGRKALKFMGLSSDEETASGVGLVIKAVAAGSPAERVGIIAGDVLLSFDHVSVVSEADIVPRRQSAQLEIRRGDHEPFVHEISLAGFTSGTIPSDILAALVLLGVAALALLLFMAPTAGIITWVERRVSAKMQSRVGPNRAGPIGFFIWLADGIKSITKEDIIPSDSDAPLFRLAPYLVFIGVSATFVVMPFGQYLIAADLDIGILFVLAVTSLVAIGLMTGGWASNNKWSLLGGIRAAAQVISYEIPAAVAIVCIVMMTGSLRMQDIIMAQGGMGQDLLATGGWPWYWFIFRNPVTFGLFFLFFTTALAEGNRAPFDLPEAESELVAGYSTEYSGMRYLFFFFAEWANVFVFCGIASALFLGGWQIPGVTPSQQEASIVLQLLGTLLFLLKSWVLIFIVIWIRWTLPRIRIDQLMNLCWKWFVPLSFAGFILSGLWVLGTTSTPSSAGSAASSEGPIISVAIQTGVGVAMFLLWVVLLVMFAKRVIFNFKASKRDLHLNPFT